MDISAPAGPAPLTPTLRDVTVVGASSGGVAALRAFVAALPAQHAGAVFVVMHMAPQGEGLLAGILDHAGPLPAVRATDGMPIGPGRIVVAVPDHHLLLEPGVVRVVRGPKENRHRPAIDPLFRSAAWAYGPRVVGVVLSGNLDDGTAGLWAVKSCGGITAVQDPAEAEFPDMPRNAIEHNRVDHCLPVQGLAQLVAHLALQPVATAAPLGPPPALQAEVRRSFTTAADLTDDRPGGQPSSFTCPACGGALWETDEGGHLRYRCHTGHGFSVDSLITEMGQVAEDSLYRAVRAMEEKAAALRRLREQWQGRYPRVGSDYERSAEELDRSSDVLRSLLARQRG
jgi:two-component system chemotaxis response regulator CheB